MFLWQSMRICPHSHSMTKVDVVTSDRKPAQKNRLTIGFLPCIILYSRRQKARSRLWNSLGRV